MADNENLEDIRISELPETDTVSGSNDYLAIVKPSPLYTSGYKTFKVKASKISSGGAISADDVSYDNTTSGLIANNVQDALDELAQGGGSTVEVTQIQITGTQIATITVDNVGTDLYAPNPWKDITGTLTAGQTSIVLSDNVITTNSTIDIYTDNNIDYTSVTVATGSVTITFDEQATDLGVKVRVS